MKAPGRSTAGSYILALLLCVMMLVATLHVAALWVADAAGYTGSVTPLTGLRWAMSGALSGTLFNRFIMMVSAGFVLAFTTFIATYQRFRASKPVKDLYGSARFATKKEIEQAGLFARKGVFVGGYKDGNTVKYLRHNGVEPIMVLAPPRSGKGVGIIVPTLVSWRESAIINDLKGELWAMTAAWRETSGGRCYRLDFSHPQSASFNVLDTVRLGSDNEIADVQSIAKMIVDPDGSGFDGRDGHWKKTAHALISGAMLYTLCLFKRDGLTASLADVGNLLSPAERTIEEVLEDMVECQHLIKGPSGTFVAARAREQRERSGEERGSVLSTARSYFSLYDDPVIAKKIAVSDFTANDLVNGDTPISVYFSASPVDAERLRPLYRLVLTALLRELTRSMAFSEGRANSNNKHPLLLLLDEFAALKKLDIITETIAYMPGYGIKAMFILQDYSQLHAIYGKDESISASCHIRVAFAPNNVETAKRLSDLTGTTTRIKRSNAKSSKANLIAQDSYNETRRALLTPDEILRLPQAKKRGTDMVEAGDMLIFVGGLYPIYGKQLLYFADDTMLARTKTQAVTQAVADGTA